MTFHITSNRNCQEISAVIIFPLLSTAIARDPSRENPRPQYCQNLSPTSIPSPNSAISQLLYSVLQLINFTVPARVIISAALNEGAYAAQQFLNLYAPSLPIKEVGTWFSSGDVIFL